MDYNELSYNDYYTLLVNLILGGEGFRSSVYDNGDGNATIGYGYNLVVRNDNLTNFQSAEITLKK
ncbi:MAG: hypothetical protein SVT56_04010 [Chloroflexota bacterium]|nr:hypothetical protein [Chloroflexota bacterium]